MAKNIKKENEIIKEKLVSPQETDVIEGIREMRSLGNSETLSEVLHLLNNKPSVELTGIIFDLLNDLKMQDSAEILVHYIKNHKNSPYLRELISACWQNGLDYSQQIGLFTELAVKNDILVTIETFSVIQENIDLVNESERYKIASSLEKRLKDISDQEKQKLLKEILSLIQPVSGPFLINKPGS